MRYIRLVPLLLMTAGCATTSSGGPGECRSDLSMDTRSMGERIDSAGLVGGLSARWPGASDRVLARVAWDSLGVLDTVQVYPGGLAERTRREVEETLGAHAARRLPAHPDPRFVFLFLGDAAGPAPRRVARFRVCAPEILHSDWLSEQLRNAGDDLELRQRRAAVIEALVGPDGRTQELRLNQSSGRLDVDQLVTNLFRRARFSPGLREGIPATLWARFPVTLRPRQRR